MTTPAWKPPKKSLTDCHRFLNLHGLTDCRLIEKQNRSHPSFHAQYLHPGYDDNTNTLTSTCRLMLD